MAISITHRTERVTGRAPSVRLPRPRTVAVALVGAAVALVGLAVLIRSSVFDARSIVVTGASHLRRAAVIATAEVGATTNVPLLDAATAERRLLGEPWIATADVSVSLPWTIRIEITERSPVAVAIDAGRRVLVAADGTILGSGTLRGVPAIVLPTTAASDGARPSAAAAASVIGAMGDELRARVNRVVVASDGTLELRLDDGVVVEYGGASLARRKAVALDHILRWAGQQADEVARIALTAPDVPAVVFAA